MRTNYYAVLNLDRNATEQEIRERFHELARKGHPDRFRSEEKARAESAFQLTTEAFNTLRDPERRQRYDQDLDQAPTEDRGPNSKRLLQVHLRRGITSYRAGRYAEAADSFHRAASADETDARCWHYLALACAQQERRSSVAMSAIRKACELEPMNAVYLKLAGKLFRLGGLTLRAEKFYNQALEWGGPDADIEQALAEIKKPG